MSFTIHSDKWPRLRGLKDTDGQPVLNNFNHDVGDQKRLAAIETIARELSQCKPIQPGAINVDHLPSEILHAGNIGFVRLGLDDDLYAAPIAGMLADAFEKTSALTLNVYDSWKKGILSTAFEYATDSDFDQGQKRRGITLIDTLHKADKARVEEIIANETYPQEWDGAVPFGNFVQTYTPRY